MTFIQILAFFHILGASLWLGSSILLGILGLEIAKTKDHNKIINSVKFIKPLSNLLFKPATITTIVAGIWIVAISRWVSLGNFWILFALAGVIITFFLGGVLIPKISKKILKEQNNTTLTLETYKKLIFIISLNSIILINILFDMIYKPKINEISFWLISIAFLIISISISYGKYKNKK